MNCNQMAERYLRGEEWLKRSQYFDGWDITAIICVPRQAHEIRVPKSTQNLQQPKSLTTPHYQPPFAWTSSWSGLWDLFSSPFQGWSIPLKTHSIFYDGNKSSQWCVITRKLKSRCEEKNWYCLKSTLSIFWHFLILNIWQVWWGVKVCTSGTPAPAMDGKILEHIGRY